MPEMLVSFGADPNAENNDGKTPMMDFRVVYERLLHLYDTQAGHVQARRELAEDLDRLTLLLVRQRSWT